MLFFLSGIMGMKKLVKEKQRFADGIGVKDINYTKNVTKHRKRDERVWNEYKCRKNESDENK